MTDLLTPEEVRELARLNREEFNRPTMVEIRGLCRDYLTLWDRNKELKAALRPFSKLGEELPTGPDWELDERPVWSFNNAVITLGEMRLAKKVLDA